MIKAFFTALSMLTVFPMPHSFMPGENDLKKAPDHFPAVGSFIAAVVFLVSLGAVKILPASCAAAVTLIFMELVSKCFHLDGLADTADAFMSSRSRERMLEIMHDSHVGTMGVFAVVSVMLLKYSALAVVAGTSGNTYAMPLTAASAALAGRCMIPFYMCLSRYARPDGLARITFEKKPYAGAVLGFVILCAGAVLMKDTPSAVMFCPVALAAFTVLWALNTRRVIGGATGDTIGACEELCEVLTLLYLAACLK